MPLCLLKIFLIHNKNGKVQVTVTGGVTCTKKAIHENINWLRKV